MTRTTARLISFFQHQPMLQLAVVILFLTAGVQPLAAVDKALNFDSAAVKPLVEIDGTNFALTESITVEAWIWFRQQPVTVPPTFPPKWQGIVTKGNDAWGLTRYLNTNRVAFRTYKDGQNFDLVAPADLAPERWYHVAGVYDGANKLLYIDGELRATAIFNGPIASNTRNVAIGGNSAVSGRNFVGKIDTVRIWSMARTQDEIAGNMLRRVRGNEERTVLVDGTPVVRRLLGAWRFDEAEGTLTALDSSSTGAHGTLQGTFAFPDREAGLQFGAPPGGNTALSFDGIDDHVEIPFEDAYDFDAAMTVESWVYIDGPAFGGNVISFFENNPAADTIQRTDGGDFIADGFTAGAVVTVQGSNSNDGEYAIDGVATTTITLSPGDALNDELNGATVRLTQVGKVAGLVSKGANAWHLGLTANGTVIFATAGVSTTELESATVLEAEKWYHITASYDSASGVKRIYVDGRLDAELTGLTNSIAANSLAVQFGHTPGAAADYFDGALDEIRLWNSARTPGLITDNYTVALNGDEPGLAGYWRFDSASGTVAVDSRATVSTTTQVIDFESLEHNDNQQLAILDSPGPHPAEVTVVSNFEYVEDGYKLVNESGVAQVPFFTVGLSHFGYSGSTALYNDDPNVDTVLTKDGGGAFNLLTMVFAEAWPNRDPGTLVTLNGTRSDGSALSQTFELDGGDISRQTFRPRGFTDLIEVRWREQPDYHQVDDIQLFDGVLEWSNSPADGRLVNMTDLNWGERGDPGLPPFALNAPPEPQYALSFNGVDDCITIPDSASLTLGTFTFEAWIKPEANGPDFRNIIMKGNFGYGVAIDVDGHVRYWVDNDSANALQSTGTVANGQWQHIAVSVDQATNTTAFYINGAPAGDFELQTVNNNTDPLVIGKQGTTLVSGLYRGLIDEIRLWNHARDPAEIAFFAGVPLTPGMSGLISYWPCNDGIGLTLADTAGANHGNLDDLCTMSATDAWLYGVMPGGNYGNTDDPYYALCFDGIDDYVHVDYSATLPGAFTFEAWIFPEENVLANTGNGGYRNLFVKTVDDGSGEVNGRGLAVDSGGALRWWSGTTDNVVTSTGTVEDDTWHHVAVVCNGATVTFYINGLQAGSVFGPAAVADVGDIYFGRSGLNQTGYYRGCLDEIRLWDRALSATEIAAGYQLRLASKADPIPVTIANLIGYWPVNDGSGVTAGSAVGGIAGDLLPNNVTGNVAIWSPAPDSLLWTTPTLGGGNNFSKNSATVGLWVGTVELNAVNEVQTAQPGESGDVTGTGSTARLRVVLHVDVTGTTRLLKDVIMLKTTGSGGGTENLVLVTDDSLIPTFQNLVEEDGKLIGRRIGSAAFDFAEHELELLGGVGAGMSVTGTMVLPRTHPTNPFRHKFHPIHRNENPEDPSFGYEITRTMSISFDTPADGDFDDGGFGVDRLTGVYREQISGLHKIPLIVEGTIRIDRISMVGALNE